MVTQQNSIKDWSSLSNMIIQIVLINMKMYAESSWRRKRLTIKLWEIILEEVIWKGEKLWFYSVHENSYNHNTRQKNIHD